MDLNIRLNKIEAKIQSEEPPSCMIIANSKEDAEAKLKELRDKYGQQHHWRIIIRNHKKLEEELQNQTLLNDSGRING